MSLSEMCSLGIKTRGAGLTSMCYKHSNPTLTLKQQMNRYTKAHLPTSSHFWSCWTFARHHPRPTSCHAGVKPPLEGTVEQKALVFVLLVSDEGPHVYFHTLRWIIRRVKRQQRTVRLVVLERLQPPYIVCCYSHLSRQEGNFTYFIHTPWPEDTSAATNTPYFVQNILFFV